MTTNRTYNVFLKNLESDPKFKKGLVWEFFLVFSRFEYALKRAGYLDKEKNYADPSWNDYAKAIDNLGQFKRDTTKELQKAVKYLENNPPKKQIVNLKGDLDWKVAPSETNKDMKWLLLQVCRVRNNLFHGGNTHINPYLNLPEIHFC